MVKWAKSLDGALINLDNIALIDVIEVVDDKCAVVAYTAGNSAITIYRGDKAACLKKLDRIADILGDYQRKV